ncbi:MAG: DUF5320 domain-containing protein [Anaerolineales bacterium]
MDGYISRVRNFSCPTIHYTHIVCFPSIDITHIVWYNIGRLDKAFDGGGEMPGFDGTGPRGEGPMTGRGEGYCAMVLRSPECGETPYGYAGLQGTPVRWVPVQRFPRHIGRLAQSAWRIPRPMFRHRPWRGVPWRRNMRRF